MTTGNEAARRPLPLGWDSDEAQDTAGRFLARLRPATRSLQGRYYSRQSQLHGACFYDGRCNQETERRIRETAAYINDAEFLAAPRGP